MYEGGKSKVSQQNDDESHRDRNSLGKSKSIDKSEKILSTSPILPSAMTVWMAMVEGKNLVQMASMRKRFFDFARETRIRA